MNPFARVALVATSVICVCATAQAADIDVIATQTSLNPVYGLDTLTGDTTWTKDNVYIMTDRVYIPNGVTLTIEPGTKIYSSFDDNGTPEDKSNDKVGTLIVCRGGKLIADGTAAEPIVFDAIQTLEAERGVDHPLDNDGLIGPEPTVGSTGLWGGVVVLGNAYVAMTAADGTNIGNKIIEGFVPTGFVDGDGDGRPDALEYGFDLTTNTHPGGTTFAQDDDDDSGIIRYVSIRHGGYEFGSDNEINGLTMAGVGRGTTIEFVEVVSNVDDAFEWFGGTVNTNNLVAAFSGDDSFDVDEGHQGNHQFLFTIQNPNLGDNLGEWDGVGGADTDSTNPSIIPSNPQFFNVTAVGPGSTSFAPGAVGKDNGLFLDDSFNGGLYNSVIHDVVNFAASFSNDGLVEEVAFANNTIGTIGQFDGSDAGSTLNNAPTGYDFYVDGLGNPVDGNTAPGVDPMFTEYDRSSGGYLRYIDPVPQAGSPLLGAALTPVPVGLETVTYRGAFGTTNWAKGWTYVDEKGYFDVRPAMPTMVDVIATQTSLNPVYGLDTLTADTTWTKDNVYIMTDRVYIPNGVTLTIEPGTKIYSSFDDNGTPEDKSNDKVGTLIVCRGGMLIADGTAAEPIVFDALQTLEAELGVDLSQDSDGVIGPKPTAGSTGLWGGVVVLGNAYVAMTAADGTNIGNKIIEGFVPTGFVDGDGDGRPDALEYGFDLTTNTHPGGTTFTQDDDDNSGTIRYVSIRHGGYEFGSDNEINGLTMAGVGRGTTIEFVEVVANVDDAFEWFGGTVNTNNLVAAFSGDDSFDVDEGHQGNHQFLFTIQNPNLGDNLGEWDGVGGADTDSTNPSIIPSNPQFFNVTAVGPGATAFAPGAVGKDNGLFLDDSFNGGLYNSVIHDVVNFAASFSADGLVEEVGFANNTIGTIGQFNGSDAGSTLNNAPTAYDFYVDGLGAPVDGNTAPGVDPMFTQYERTAEGYLLGINPVPATGSPLLSAPLSPVPVGLSTVSYRGAFNKTNWAKGWTYVSEQGYFGATENPGTGEPPFADVDNDGISDTLENSPALQALGFNVGTNDAALFASLFTETSIQDLSANDIIVQKTGTTATLSIPVERSTNLVPPFTPAGNAVLELNDVPADKEFYRFRVAPDAAE